MRLKLCGKVSNIESGGVLPARANAVIMLAGIGLPFPLDVVTNPKRGIILNEVARRPRSSPDLVIKPLKVALITDPLPRHCVHNHRGGDLLTPFCSCDFGLDVGVDHGGKVNVGEAGVCRGCVLREACERRSVQRGVGT